MLTAVAASSATIAASPYTASISWLPKSKPKRPSLTTANSPKTLCLREELSEQIRALGELKAMGASYGFDIGRPGSNRSGSRAVDLLRLPAPVKEQNGAAMSIGRISSFLDVYIERDLKAGRITEEQAQEFIDHLVMKLRIVRFLRTEEYNSLYSGDPTSVTGIHRRHERRRPFAGHQEQLPLPAHPV